MFLNPWNHPVASVSDNLRPVVEDQEYCEICGAETEYISQLRRDICPRGCKVADMIEEEMDKVMELVRIEQSECDNGDISRAMTLDNVLTVLVTLREGLAA